jgi:(p)ppGpp synthase/HD superfamily hydrolase
MDAPAKPTEPDLIVQARLFCTSAHAWQTRGNGKPFHTHPFAVADLIREHGMLDSEVVAAAYLHDIIEDTKTTRYDLSKKFGERVANLVEELTVPEATAKTFDDKQKALQTKARTMSADAKWIKLADRVHNLSEKHPQWPKDKRQRYALASVNLLDALRPWPSQSLAEEVVRLIVALVAE